MCDQTEVSYLPKDIVWVKLSNVWWPAEVQDLNELDEEVTQGLRKQPLAVVKFLNEDKYEFVKNIEQICHYNSLKKFDFIQKGLDMKDKKHMEKFPDDVILAEKMTKGNPNILKDPRFTKEKSFDYQNIFAYKSGKNKSSNKGKTMLNGDIVSSGKTTVRITTPVNHRRAQRTERASLYSQALLDSIHQRLDISPAKTGHINENTLYNCPHDGCYFKATRISIIQHHTKFYNHQDSSKDFRGKLASFPCRPKDRPVKRKSDAETHPSKAKRKMIPEIKTDIGSAKKQAKKKSNKGTKEVVKKKDLSEAVRQKLLQDWSDSEEENLQDSMEVNGSLNESDKVVSTKDSEVQSPAKSCFDFEENDEAINLDESLKFGQKLPRVVNDKHRRELDIKDSDKDISPDLKDLNDDFNILMKETVVASIPSLPEPFLSYSSVLPVTTGKAEETKSDHGYNLEYKETSNSEETPSKNDFQETEQPGENNNVKLVKSFKETDQSVKYLEARKISKGDNHKGMASDLTSKKHVSSIGLAGTKRKEGMTSMDVADGKPQIKIQEDKGKASTKGTDSSPKVPKKHKPEGKVQEAKSIDKGKKSVSKTGKSSQEVTSSPDGASPEAVGKKIVGKPSKQVDVKDLSKKVDNDSKSHKSVVNPDQSGKKVELKSVKDVKKKYEDTSNEEESKKDGKKSEKDTSKKNKRPSSSTDFPEKHYHKTIDSNDRKRVKPDPSDTHKAEASVKTEAAERKQSQKSTKEVSPRKSTSSKGLSDVSSKSHGKTSPAETSGSPESGRSGSNEASKKSEPGRSSKEGKPLKEVDKPLPKKGNKEDVKPEEKGLISSKPGEDSQRKSKSDDRKSTSNSSKKLLFEDSLKINSVPASGEPTSKGNKTISSMKTEQSKVPKSDDSSSASDYKLPLKDKNKSETKSAEEYPKKDKPKSESRRKSKEKYAKRESSSKKHEDHSSRVKENGSSRERTKDDSEKHAAKVPEKVDLKKLPSDGQKTSENKDLVKRGSKYYSSSAHKKRSSHSKEGKDKHDTPEKHLASSDSLKTDGFSSSCSSSPKQSDASYSKKSSDDKSSSKKVTKETKKNSTTPLKTTPKKSTEELINDLSSSVPSVSSKKTSVSLLSSFQFDFTEPKSCERPKIQKDSKEGTGVIKSEKINDSIDNCKVVKHSESKSLKSGDSSKKSPREQTKSSLDPGAETLKGSSKRTAEEKQKSDSSESSVSLNTSVPSSKPRPLSDSVVSDTSSESNSKRFIEPSKPASEINSGNIEIDTSGVTSVGGPDTASGVVEAVETTAVENPPVPCEEEKHSQTDSGKLSPDSKYRRLPPDSEDGKLSSGGNDVKLSTYSKGGELLPDNKDVKLLADSKEGQLLLDSKDGKSSPDNKDSISSPDSEDFKSLLDTKDGKSSPDGKEAKQLPDIKGDQSMSDSKTGKSPVKVAETSSLLLSGFKLDVMEKCVNEQSVAKGESVCVPERDILVKQTVRARLEARISNETGGLSQVCSTVRNESGDSKELGEAAAVVSTSAEPKVDESKLQTDKPTSSLLPPLPSVTSYSDTFPPEHSTAPKSSAGIEGATQVQEPPHDSIAIKIFPEKNKGLTESCQTIKPIIVPPPSVFESTSGGASTKIENKAAFSDQGESSQSSMVSNFSEQVTKEVTKPAQRKEQTLLTNTDVQNMELDINSMPFVFDDAPEMAASLAESLDPPRNSRKVKTCKVYLCPKGQGMKKILEDNLDGYEVIKIPPKSPEKAPVLVSTPKRLPSILSKASKPNILNSFQSVSAASRLIASDKSRNTLVSNQILVAKSPLGHGSRIVLKSDHVAATGHKSTDGKKQIIILNRKLAPSTLSSSTILTSSLSPGTSDLIKKSSHGKILDSSSVITPPGSTVRLLSNKRQKLIFTDPKQSGSPVTHLKMVLQKPDVLIPMPKDSKINTLKLVPNLTEAGTASTAKLINTNTRNLNIFAKPRPKPIIREKPNLNIPSVPVQPEMSNCANLDGSSSLSTLVINVNEGSRSKASEPVHSLDNKLLYIGGRGSESVNLPQTCKPLQGQDILAKAIANTQVLQNDSELPCESEVYEEQTIYSEGFQDSAMEASYSLSQASMSTAQVPSTSSSQGPCYFTVPAKQIEPSMPLITDEVDSSQVLIQPSVTSSGQLFFFNNDGPSSEVVYSNVGSVVSTSTQQEKDRVTRDSVSDFLTFPASKVAPAEPSCDITANVNLAEIELPPDDPPTEFSAPKVHDIVVPPDNIASIPLPPEPYKGNKGLSFTIARTKESVFKTQSPNRRFVSPPKELPSRSLKFLTDFKPSNS